MKEALDKIDNLNKEMQSLFSKFESLVVMGQRMANLLKGVPETSKDYALAKELIQRWEKEFR